VLRQWLARWGRRATRRPGLTGFTVGVAAGAALAVLVTQVIVPGLRREGLETGGELVILSGTDDGSGGQREQLIDKWNRLGGGRPKARIEVVQGDTNRQRAEMLRRAQGNGEPVDIYNLDVIDMAEFRKFGYIRPLDESRVTEIEGFLPNPMRTCRDANGQLWALPFHTDAALLYYRDDLGLPPEPANSLAALDDAIKMLSLQGKSLSAGFAGQLDDYEGLTVNAIEAIWAAGGSVVDSDGNVTVDSELARKGLKWLAQGLRSGNPQLILPAARGYDEAETAQAFADGKVAFMRNWPVWYNRLKDETGKPKLPYKVKPLPGPSVLGGRNLAVAATSPRPRAAQALIDFLTGPLSQQILFERGGFPATRLIVYQDKGIHERYEYADQLLAAINGADLRPETAYYDKFSQVFRQGVQHAMDNGGELPAGFADTLADALKGISH
jgi:multiple sugar transport system substrate-binding protein